jgi:hypothetical protein
LEYSTPQTKQNLERYTEREREREREREKEREREGERERVGEREGERERGRAILPLYRRWYSLTQATEAQLF